MMKILSFLTALGMLMLLPFSCNPDCQSLQGVTLSSSIMPEGYEIYIDATPREALRDKKVFFNDIAVIPEFESNGLMKVKVPAGLTVNQESELRIEDPDCTDVFAFPFKVVDMNYFTTIENYSPPIPPEIVIPTPNVPYPASVDNAWLSPENPGYCLWFTMYKDTISVKGDTISTKIIDPENSFEQATCCCDRDSDLPYAQNRIGGIVDIQKNKINFYIDRTQRGGDIEYFSGIFIDRSQVPQYADNTGQLTCPIGDPKDPGCVGGNNCAGQDKVSPPANQNYMMLLTSEKTGRQLIVYQLKL